MSQPLIMGFRPDAAEMCLDGRKTMTRRMYKKTYMSAISADGSVGAIGDCGVEWEAFDPSSLKIIWAVGQTIAIKPGRTAKAVGRVMCTGLRVEHVQDITEEDARWEGMTVLPLQTEEDPSAWWTNGNRHEGHRTARLAFQATWKALYPSGPKSWDENPLVVVIEFRPLREGEV